MSCLQRHSRPRLLHRSNTDAHPYHCRCPRWPVELTGGLMIDRHDLRSTHEEADILIAQHAISLSLLDKSVRVVCDDTDIFVLLVPYYNNRCTCSNRAPMIMSSPVKKWTVIDIRATEESHSDVADDLLAIHGLSGADEVASFHGIGKATVGKVAKKGCFPLFCIGDVHAEIKSHETPWQNIGSKCGAQKQGRVVHHQWNSVPFHQLLKHSQKMCTYATFKRQYGKQHFLSHHQKWTQRGMAGSLTTYTCRCSGSANSAFWYIVGPPRTEYSSFTASTRHLGVTLQHVAARKLGARSSVYVRVRKPVKILWRVARREMNPKRLLRTQTMMICDETIIKLMRTHHKHAKLHSCLNKLNLTLNICVFL